MAGYEEYHLALHPPPLRRPYGELWARAHGAFQDNHEEAAKQAVKARFVEVCPPDALEYHASERSLERMPADTEAEWRARLLNAWELWKWAGTKKGVIDAVKLTGLENVEIKEYWDWPDPIVGFQIAHTFADPATHILYIGGPSTDKWAKFWVIIDQPHPWETDGTWGDPGVYGDGGTWGSTATQEETHRLRRMVQQWKPAHAWCVNIIIILSGELWGDPVGVWGDPGTWGGEAIYLEI